MNKLVFILCLLPIAVFGQVSIEQNPSSEARFPGCESNGLAYDDKLACADMKLNDFLYKNMEYPADAKEQQLSGNARLSFVIEKDGSLSEIKVVSISDKVFEEEAMRLGKLLPNFIPAKKGDEIVRSQKEIELAFIFEKKKGKKVKKRDMRRDLAKQRIELLKEGTLVVRLQSRTNKINALTKLAKEASMEKRPEYQAMLEKEVFERDSLNKELITFFSDDNYFNFCSVLFFYDSDTDLYAKGVEDGYFVGKDLKVDPSISLNGQKSLMTHIGTTPISPDKRVSFTAFVLKDAYLSPLSSPFPAYVTFRKKIVGDKGLEMRYSVSDMPLAEAVQKLNARLFEFYKNVQEW